MKYTYGSIVGLWFLLFLCGGSVNLMEASQAPSISPSVSPSEIPSISPSTEPSVAPTLSTSFTLAPSSAPIATTAPPVAQLVPSVPTRNPVVIVTRTPSVVPSVAPTYTVTAVPTADVTLQIATEMIIVGITLTTYQSDIRYSTILTTGIASSVTRAATRNVINLVVTGHYETPPSPPSGRYLEEDTSNSLKINFIFEFYSTDNVGTYNEIITEMAASINSLAVMDNLRNNSQAIGLTGFDASVIWDLIVECSLGCEGYGSQKDTLSELEKAGALLVFIVGSVLLCVICTCCYSHHCSSHGKRPSEFPKESELSARTPTLGKIDKTGHRPRSQRSDGLDLAELSSRNISTSESSDEPQNDVRPILKVKRSKDSMKNSNENLNHSSHERLGVTQPSPVNLTEIQVQVVPIVEGGIADWTRPTLRPETSIDSFNHNFLTDEQLESGLIHESNALRESLDMEQVGVFHVPYRHPTTAVTSTVQQQNNVGNHLQLQQPPRVPSDQRMNAHAQHSIPMHPEVLTARGQGISRQSSPHLGSRQPSPQPGQFLSYPPSRSHTPLPQLAPQLNRNPSYDQEPHLRQQMPRLPLETLHQQPQMSARRDVHPSYRDRDTPPRLERHRSEAAYRSDNNRPPVGRLRTDLYSPQSEYHRSQEYRDRPQVGRLRPDVYQPHSEHRPHREHSREHSRQSSDPLHQRPRVERQRSSDIAYRPQEYRPVTTQQQEGFEEYRPQQYESRPRMHRHASSDIPRGYVEPHSSRRHHDNRY